MQILNKDPYFEQCYNPKTQRQYLCIIVSFEPSGGFLERPLFPPRGLNPVTVLVFGSIINLRVDSYLLSFGHKGDGTLPICRESCENRGLISVSSSSLFSFSGMSQPITSGDSRLTSSVCDCAPS